MKASTIYSIIGVLVVVGGVVAGSMLHFQSKTEAQATEEEIKQEIAGLSLIQQQQITQQRIAWLEEQIINIQNQYGNPPGANCPAWIKENWNSHIAELKRKRKLLEEIDKQITLK